MERDAAIETAYSSVLSSSSPAWTSAWRSTNSQTSLERPRSNSLDISLPSLAVEFQWIRLMLSPNAYSRTLAAWGVRSCVRSFAKLSPDRYDADVVNPDASKIFGRTMSLSVPPNSLSRLNSPKASELETLTGPIV